MKGYVIFNTENDFISAHNAEKTALGLPLINNNQGKPAINKQQTINITNSIKHPNENDNRVIAYINGGWRDISKTGFTFLTKDQAKIEGWFIEEEV